MHITFNSDITCDITCEMEHAAKQILSTFGKFLLRMDYSYIAVLILLLKYNVSTFPSTGCSV